MKKPCPAILECEECFWFRPWDMVRDGVVERQERCSIEVLLLEIPKIRAAIDGLQSGVNQARNRSMETQETVLKLGVVMGKAFKLMDTKLLEKEEV